MDSPWCTLTRASTTRIATQQFRLVQMHSSARPSSAVRLVRPPNRVCMVCTGRRAGKPPRAQMEAEGGKTGLFVPQSPSDTVGRRLESHDPSVMSMLSKRERARARHALGSSTQIALEAAQTPLGA